MKPNTNLKARKPSTIDEYLAAVPPDKRAALQKLRRTIRSAIPGAEECISYGLPAFRYEGRMVAWFGAAKNHCSFYPGGVVSACEKELEGYDTSKGTIRFPPDAALPASLVKKLLKARIAANAARRPTRS
jgi:uncharacterized protein YdhG (YjbR/CyaY superfamily)